eukprot:TRINITY_DN29195_c0_g1_i1.p1 TRINITY_DN29195_c0_g1~~TRINITY_DN29195_c0_g1_i1.p1  ORF type:complete len:181 (+),score=38.32 TRINITY_DN29195_c0_g1_i1:383-925(+)
MGCVTRVHGRVLIKLHLVEKICGFLTQRPLLLEFSLDVVGVVGEAEAGNKETFMSEPVATASERATPVDPRSQHSEEAPADEITKDVSESSDIEEALELSNAMAEQEEGSHVAAALVQSKIDAPPVSCEDAVVFRLTRVSQNILRALLEAPELAEMRARTTDAGCELRPDFAGGAQSSSQ